MDKKQEKFMQELLADFNIEAAEHLQIFVNGLLDLEKDIQPADAAKIVETIFREIHSAKGAARAVNQAEIERVCQSLESALAALKAGRIAISPPLVDTMHEAGDLLGVMLRDLSSGTRTHKGEYILNMVCRLTDLAQGQIPTPAVEKENKQDPSKERGVQFQKQVPSENKTLVSHEGQSQQETVRISREKLTSLMIQAEEFIASKSMSHYFSKDISGIMTLYYGFWKQTEARLKELNSETSSGPLAMDDFLKSFREAARELHERISRLNRLFGQYDHNISRMIDELLLSIRKTLLIPFSTILDIFPKMVRDLSKDNGKEILLNIQGNSIEIDRRILEEIKDPLIHLIRNCIDHGIESPEERIKLDKPRQGQITISIKRTQNKEIQVEIEDDGSGINDEKVTHSAIKEGIITEETARSLTHSETLQLIFRSGVSTSPLITDISGRGLGLAIVSDKIISLGGSVSLRSGQGKGSCFTLILPLTLATFRGVLVRMGEHFFMVPINSVEKVIRMNRSGIHLAEKQETMVYENHHIPVFRMCDALGFQSGKSKSSKSFAYLIIISSGKKKIGFHIDEVIGEQEGIIKPLGGQLLNVRHLSGATVLGDGKVVPVIDASELLDSVSTSGFATSKKHSDVPEEEIAPAARILVAEDSLTSRSLLRNLLESAGYEVRTAVDGWEAFTLLKQCGFDLVVSDIEMPRMNGFELTSKIRSEPGMSSLPVVLVTALETSEDRQRGLEAGASAYIMKSSFEGSNLVSTIQRLI